MDRSRSRPLVVLGALSLLCLVLAACANRGPELIQPVGQWHTTAVALRPTAAELERTRPQIEGRLTIATDGPRGDVLRYTIKGDAVRVVLASADERPQLDVILDGRRGVAALLLAEKKEYALLDLDALARGGRVSTSTIATIDTGVRLRVDGQLCEVWSFADAGSRGGVRACVVKAAPAFDLASIETAVGATAPVWLRKIAAEGAVPMRVELLEDGGPRLVAELVTDAPIPDAQLVIPEGYSKLAP
jgi:hypothetical protein